ncbi:MAG: PPC domain-containing protein [Nitrospirae bacterium]|nr:PPC domain-containing protein [Nitrospirota bacterium]
MKRLSALAFVLVALLTAGGCGTNDSATGTAGHIVSPSEPFSLSGRIRYADKEYGMGGFTGSTSLKAVRFARIEAYSVNAFGMEQVVASGETGADGSYLLAIAGITGNLRMRVFASTGAGTPMTINVNDTDGNLYAVSSSTGISSESVATLVRSAGDTLPFDFDIPLDNGADPAFNLLDIYTAASEFIESLALSKPLPSELRIFWGFGSAKGTWYCSDSDPVYCPMGSGAYILGGNADGSGDTDHFDDDVNLHEFGHFIAKTYSVDESPGGDHSFTETDLDLRMAFSEGWGDFFQTAVKTWLKLNRPDVLSISDGTALTAYIDTYEHLAQIAIDIGSLPSSAAGDPYVYSSNEIAVANILLNVMNSFGMDAIWGVIQNYFPATANRKNLEAFWDGILQTAAPDQAGRTQLETIFSNRRVYYIEDSYEADNAISTDMRAIEFSKGEGHYLYRADGLADKDVVAFTAAAGKNYTIQTYCLKNGADSYLALYDSSGTVIAENDDDASLIGIPSGVSYLGCSVDRFTAYASRITFSPAASGVYYAEVKTSPAPLAFAGRYGTYSLRVVEQ